MKNVFLVLPSLALAACAVLANVTPIGNGAFMATSHSNDVNATAAGEKAKAMGKADAFCGERRTVVDVIRVDAPAPAPGQPPAAEVDFRCKPAS